MRSSSAVGISVVKVVFNWGTDVYRARQLVTERLQQVQEKLPEGVGAPQLSPVSSPIGTILMYAFTIASPEQAPNTQATDLMELRRIVDQTISNRLLSVPGVSQVLAYGGDVRQYQVLVNPKQLAAFNITLQEVTDAAEAANSNAAGGFLVDADRETIIRGIGRIESIEQLQQAVITARNGTPIRLRDVADVRIGAALKRGDGSANGEPAIIVVVNKQPQIDTPTVTRSVEAAMEGLIASLPADIKVTETFRQESFIAAAVKNVQSSLWAGIIIVSIVLILFFNELANSHHYPECHSPISVGGDDNSQWDGPGHQPHDLGRIGRCYRVGGG